MTQQLLTPHQSQYYAWLLTRRAAGDTVESLASTLVDSQVDLNPHQVEAALFACKNPLSRGVILADEVGFGKTIEAGLEEGNIPLGRYELPRRSGDAYLYRIGHPLAAWVIHQAKTRDLPSARLVFDYEAYGTHVSSLKSYRGKTGWLILKLIFCRGAGQPGTALGGCGLYSGWYCTGRRRSGKTAALARNCARYKLVQ